MDPFRIEAPWFKLLSQYPSPSELLTISTLSIAAREMLVRLWLTEGIPFAFRECPAAYDTVRAWLASRLQVCPKEITLLGSARLGYSLKSGQNYGRAFTAQSDLDFSIISGSLFEELSKAFEQWRTDYTTGVVHPRNNQEQQLWNDNARWGAQNIRRGFLDVRKIPTFSRYPFVQSLADTMWRLSKKLEMTQGAPRVKVASVRVYHSWKALVAQVSLNLWHTVRHSERSTLE
jgi:hypothetical protein